MKTLYSLLILALLASPLLADTITPEQAAAHIGNQHRIVGIVSAVHTTSKGTIFINFGGKYPNHVFTAVVFPKNAAAFGDPSKYEGKKVAVIGMIKDYKGKPEVILFTPSQIGILE